MITILFNNILPFVAERELCFLSFDQKCAHLWTSLCIYFRECFKYLSSWSRDSYERYHAGIFFI